MHRIREFDGVHNFRDFGGYRAGARAVKTGLLFRSAHHAHASEADLSKLAEMEFAAIVDLRRPKERRRDPSRRWRGFSANVIENDLDDLPDDAEDPYHSMLRRSDLDSRVIHAWNLDYYRNAPFAARHIDLFRRYFAALRRADGPVLIHCAIGRDRTGILVALTQHMLGVHKDDILAEYLLTNDNSRIAERMPDLIAFVAALAGKTPDARTLHALTHVQPELLAAAFQSIAARHGSLDSYLTQALGVDDRTRDAIAEFVLTG
jgi:protein-tyrosine phosphatase